LRKGKSPILPGEEREEKVESMVGAGRCRWCPLAESVPFQVLFKTYSTPQESRPRRFPPNNEWVGGVRGMGGSWGR
jgi:hypothetical protein